MELNENQLKAVLFDLGGTLIQTGEIPEVMKRVLQDRGIHRSLQEIQKAWRKGEEDLDFRDLTRLLDEFWVRWNVRILSNLQIKSDIRTLAEFIAAHWWDYSNVTLYQDARKMLPLLKERALKIGLITNGLQSDVDVILRRAGLQDFFDVIVMIDTLRKMKPDVEVFRHALQELNVSPAQAIFIGDEMEADYKGAQRAGLSAFLIDRKGRVQDENVNKISTLEDLLRLKIIQ